MKHWVVIWGLVVCTTGQTLKSKILTFKDKRTPVAVVSPQKSSGGYLSNGFTDGRSQPDRSKYSEGVMFKAPSSDFVPVNPYQVSGNNVPVQPYPYDLMANLFGSPNLGFPSTSQEEFSSLFQLPSSPFNFYTPQFNLNNLNTPVPSLNTGSYPAASDLLPRVTKLGPVTFGVGHGGLADTSR